MALTKKDLEKVQAIVTIAVTTVVDERVTTIIDERFEKYVMPLHVWAKDVNAVLKGINGKLDKHILDYDEKYKKCEQVEKRVHKLEFAAA